MFERRRYFPFQLLSALYNNNALLFPSSTKIKISNINILEVTCPIQTVGSEKINTYLPINN